MIEQRWGDSLAVRGSGADTQILAATRASGIVAVFTTEDGVNFSPTLFSNAAHGSGSLGCAFGPGDTIYTKNSSQPLVLSSFDLVAGTAEQLQTYTTLSASARPIVAA